MIHVLRDTKVLVVPFRPDLATLFPHAKEMMFQGRRSLIMPHGQDETRMLRNMDYPVPAPITEHYAFPGRNRPFEAQIKTSAAMTMQPRFFCLNGMGTGKTRSTLWAYDWLRARKLARRMLVICPLSTMRFTWEREIEDNLPHLVAHVIYGTRKKRLAQLAKPADIQIINHDGVRTVLNHLVADRTIDVVVFDEVAVYRNSQAVRSKLAYDLARGRGWVWGLTGSPTPNEVTDAYGLLKLITPDKCPRSFVRFRDSLMLPQGPFNWVPRKDAAERVAELLQPCTRYTLDEIVELPQMVMRKVHTGMGARQAAVYAKMRDEMAVLLKEGQITAANGGVHLGKLLQISSGFVYDDDGKPAVFDPDERLEAMLNAIENTKGKTIVFSSWKQSADLIDKFLTREKIDHRNVVGDTPTKQRDEIFRLFQNTDRPRVLNANPRTMSHGLTLTLADTIIWFSPTTSLETFEQANARIRRIGQSSKQQVLMLTSTSADTRTYQRLQAKADLQESVLDLLASVVAE